MNANGTRHSVVFLRVAAFALLLVAMAALASSHFVSAEESSPQQIPAVTPQPTPAATPGPTADPTPEPAPEATPEPTTEATPEPVADPTPEPTPIATPEPTPEPAPEATPEPTTEATPEPVADPTPEPTPIVTPEPTPAATPEPTPEAIPDPAPTATPEPTPEATPEPVVDPTPAATPAPTQPPAQTKKVTPEPPQQERREVQGQNSEKVTTLSLTRIGYSTETKPGLLLSWSAPADTSQLNGYEFRYRKKGDTKWKRKSGSSYLTSREAKLEGLDLNTEYEAQVKGTGGGSPAWSDVTSARTNRAPAATTSNYPDISVPWRPNTHFTYLNLNNLFKDADGDTLTYSVSSGKPAIAGASVEDRGNPAISLEKHNPGATTITYAASDPYGGYFARTFVLTITANETRSVAENSPAGTAVGVPIAGTPYNGETLTHSLTGEAATSGVFAIDSATGQISVTGSGCDALDYETKTSYTGQVNYTVNGNSVAVPVTINVTDVAAEKPCPPGTLTITRTASSEPMDPALDVTWTAPSDNGTAITEYRVRYRKQAATCEESGSWESVKATTTSAKLPDLEAGAVYEVRARAINANGTSGWSDCYTGTANTPPHTTGFILDDTIPWGHSYGYTFDGHIFQDTEGDALTFFVSAANPGIMRASIVEGTPHDSLFMVASNPGSTEVTYGVRDPYGGSVALTMTATGVANPTRSIAENSPAGTAVGRTVAGAPYDDGDDSTDDTLTHALTGEAADAFVIDAATGQISVKQGATLDYETKSSYTGKVEWTVNGQDVEANLTINVTDVEAVMDAAPTVSRTEFSEPTKPALDVTWTAAAANGLTVTGYEAQWRKKVADGETANAWTLYEYEDPDNPGTDISLLPATATTINLPGLDAGATYEAQVRAITSEEAEGPWSDAGEGRANRPPNKTYAILIDATYKHYATTIAHLFNPSGPYGVFFEDADGDTLSATYSSQYPGIISVWVEGGAVGRIWASYDNPGSSILTYGAYDGYGGYVSRTVTITVSSDWPLEVPENSATGTQVQDRPVVGRPYDDGDDQTDDALTYTLTGEASAAFEIDSATGWISVKQGASLDYETKDSYTGQVNWTVQGQAAVANITINVTDVEGVIASAPTVTRTQFSEPTDPALDVTWTAAAANGLTVTGYEAQYRKKVADGETANAWMLYEYDDPDNPGTQISALPAAATTVNLPGLEAGATYETQVRAITSEEAEGPWSDTGEGTANQPPMSTGIGFTSGQFNWGDRGLIPNQVTTHFTDDDGDTLNYSASSPYPGLVNVWFSGARLGVHALNPTPAGGFHITYRAQDPYGGVSGDARYRITVVANVSRSIPERSPGGTAVGNPVAGTPYDDGDDQTDDALTHTLTGEATDAFVIDAATGQISVKEGASLDYETKDSYTGEVKWTVQGQTASANLTINVTDVEAVVAAPTVTRTQFSEPTDPALDVTWTAAAANGLTVTGYEVQYRKKVAEGETANAWTLYTYDDPDNPGTPISKLAATATTVNLPDLDAGATYEAQARAVTTEEAEGPWSDTGEGTANTPPNASAVSLNDATVAWKASADYDLSDKFADADSDTLTHSASSQYPGVLSAAVSGSNSDTLTVTVINPDVATTITYAASDPFGGYVSRTVAITGKGDVTRSIPENSAAGTAVGDPVTGTPYDDGDDQTDDALRYELTWDDGHDAAEDLFVIDGTTGQISVKQGATLDYEGEDQENSYTGAVNWTVQDQTASASLTINVTDVEAGKPGTPTLARTEFSEPTDPALDVTWTAPAANGATITGYNLQYRKKVAAGKTPNQWTDYTRTYTDPQTQTEVTTAELLATTTSVTVPELDAGATYEAQVRALTSLEGEGPWSDTGEGAANRPPNKTRLYLANDSGVLGSFLNAWLPTFFKDGDGDSLVYSKSSTNQGVVNVWLHSSSLMKWKLLNPGKATITYGAHDPYGGYVSRTVDYTATANPIRSVPENSPEGTSVGAPVTGTSYPKGTVFTHTLSGDAADSGLFVIDATTGQISVAQGATLDYETKSSYAGQVSWVVLGYTSVANVTINVTDLSPPEKPDTPTVAEPAADPTTRLDVSWTAPDTDGMPITGYQIQYRRKAAEGETPVSWTLYKYDDPDNPGSQISLLSSDATSVTVPGLDKDATYEVRVQALNIEGASDWSDASEGATKPENTSPAFPSKLATKRTVPENSPAGTLVGDPVTAADSEGHALTYSFKSDSQLFSIDSATGQISVKEDASLDYETQSTYRVIVQASDGLDSEWGNDHIIDKEATVDISLIDEPPPPQLAAPSVTRSTSSPLTSLNVAWTAPDMTGRSPVSSYDLQFRLRGADEWKLRKSGKSSTNKAVIGLSSGTTYEFRVAARNAEGLGAWSPVSTGTTANRIVNDPYPPLEPPQSTPSPTPAPTPAPTPGPTPAPTPEPTPQPTPDATPGPTPQPTPEGTPGPTPDPTPDATPGPTPEPTPDATPGPTPQPTPASVLLTAQGSAEDQDLSLIPEPTPGLNLVSNPQVPERRLVAREVGQASLSLPVRLVSGDDTLVPASREIGLAGLNLPVRRVNNDDALVSSSGEFDVFGEGSTSAQVMPDDGPGLSSANPGFWFALGLPLFLLPLLFLMWKRRRRKRERERRRRFAW